MKKKTAKKLNKTYWAWINARQKAYDEEVAGLDITKPSRHLHSNLNPYSEHLSIVEKLDRIQNEST